MKTARQSGIRTVAVYSDADRNSMHVEMADEAYHIGSPEPQKSYLNIEKILNVAKDSGAQGVHPGYGFLSENSTFSEECERNGITFIGPSGHSMNLMASKSAAKTLMQDASVPVVPGYHGEGQDIEQLAEEAEKIGFPVLIKAVLGGGGKGMRIVENMDQLKEAIDLAQREAASSFGDSRILIEKYIRKPRHVEVQVFSDKHDNHVYLWDRDCSVQRRYQKIIEEAPAPGLEESLRRQMGSAAVNAARAVQYTGAGTVEFILDRETDEFYFMEMNTRLQVEHPVTEMITGVDLVKWQFEIACGHPLPLSQEQIPLRGHAVESRIYAENPSKDFMPGSGTVSYLRTPSTSSSVRIDTGIREGDTVSVFYDPMIAKLIVWDQNRHRAMQKMRKALDDFRVSGLSTNISFLKTLASHPSFLDVDIDTGFIPRHRDTLFPPEEATKDAHFAIGSLARSLSSQKNEKKGAWEQLNNMRVNHTHSRIYRFIDNNLSEDSSQREVEVKMETSENGSYNITVSRSDSKPVQFEGVTATLDSDGQLEVRLAGKKTVCSFKEQGDSLDLFLADDRTSLTFEPIKMGGGEDTWAGSLLAPVTGQVKSILVQKGDLVQKGQTLIIMSAMKMEFVVQAPSDGVVDTVLCLEGATVNENHQVVQLHTEPSSEE
eukprot:CAMPEP_0201479292 /NCGR_PEP_ID=MMETSP0151_2-20130828/3992_1 /ASSEMBLY_ACC=CAM_ASM_000257 /TAXON_ID=200890 /ORGANISM="Paramoeba atlantica, Strain 621/1 / CCAP 1560/9" /LENGTH=658 /DNA_ID=CAMNT_0047860701 /DNA_START=190 /DNA_END=2166 /DNA_ORIENTATION=+